MYNIGEKIMYGATGLMEIVDLREEDIFGEPKQYYILRALDSKNTSETYVPKDNERLVSMMRPLMTKAEIDDLLSKMRGGRLRPIEWNNDNRKRSEYFKGLLESGDREGMLSMIITVYENGIARREMGKKNFLVDENYMRKAEKLLSDELSLVIGLTLAEIPGYLGNYEE